MSEFNYVIGIQIHIDWFKRTIGLSYKAYIERVLDKFKISECKANATLIVKGDKFNLIQCLKNALEKQEMENTPYASLVDSLMYAQACIRPGITFAIVMLDRYQSNPRIAYWKATKKVMRYLQGTKNCMLFYKHVKNLELIGCSNLDFTRCQDSRKSTSEQISMLVGGVISYKSAKQIIVASSIIEAEFIACFKATSQVKCFRSFITGLRVMDSITKPLTTYRDKSTIVFFLKNIKSRSYGKHIDIKYLLVWDRIKN